MPGLDHHLHELFVKEVLEVFKTGKVITNALNCSLKLDGKIPLLKTPQDLLIRHGEIRLEMSGKLGLCPKMLGRLHGRVKQTSALHSCAVFILLTAYVEAGTDPLC